MADIDEDQYEYPGDQTITEQEPTGEGILSELGFPSNMNMATLKKLVMDRRVYLPLGMMFGIFLISHLVGMLAGSHSKSKAEKTPPAAVQVAKDEVKVTDNVAKQVEAEQARNTATDEKLVGLAQSSEDHQKAIAQLTENIQSLSNAMQASSHDVAEIRHQLNDLAQMVKQVMPKKTSAKGGPKITYSLRAMIEGRAWIRDSDMRSYTVKVGDHLGDLGKVISINSETGEVKFSSGKVISYGSNDS